MNARAHKHIRNSVVVVVVVAASVQMFTAHARTRGTRDTLGFGVLLRPRTHLARAHTHALARSLACAYITCTLEHHRHLPMHHAIREECQDCLRARACACVLVRVRARASANVSTINNCMRALTRAEQLQNETAPRRWHGEMLSCVRELPE